ncbi:hypothetical protein JCM11251_002752 [Rhodosporidiobolus azoricus]
MSGPTSPLAAREEWLPSNRPESPKPVDSPRERDYASWAPLRARSLSSHFSHLPPLSPQPSQRDPASFRTSQPAPPPTPVQASIAFALSRLLSLPSFAQLLSTPSGLNAFQDYLTAFSSPLLPTLRLYSDILSLRSLTSAAASGARGMRDVYLLPGAEDEVQLEQRELREAVEGLRKVVEGRSALERTGRRALERLYAGAFEEYVKHKLLGHTKLQLEKRKLGADNVAGLGEAFVLSDPRQLDQPIVLASPAFCSLTGYHRDQIVGRNCRFLQGEATSPEDVSAIRKAIKEHQPITRLLLNYAVDGTPFYNLLCILPVFSPDGELTYFIGGQTNITGALTASSALALARAPQNGDEEDDVSTLAHEFAGTSLEPSISNSAPPDLSTFSQSVQRAASNPSMTPLTDTSSLSSNGASAGSPSPSPSIEAAEPRSVFSTPTFTLPSDTSPQPPRHHRQAPSLSGLFKFGGAAEKTQRVSTTPPIAEHPAAEVKRRVEVGQGTVERRIEEFAATYERVAIFRAADRRIIHTTGPFLRFLGLPGSTQQETNASPLVDADLLDLLRGIEGEKDGEKEVKRKVKSAVAEGRGCSVECAIRVEGKKIGKSSLPSYPTARGVLHLSPLQDYEGKGVAYVAIAFQNVGGYRASIQSDPFTSLARSSEGHDYAQPAQPHSQAQHPPAMDDLREWAPEAPPFEQLAPSGMPHLPSASGLSILGGQKKKVEKGTTSKPSVHPLALTRYFPH